jgi:hypothetical protein
MLTRTFPLTLLTLVLIGCASNEPTSPSGLAELRAARAAGAAIERPWKGRCEVETSITEFGSTGPTKFHQVGICQLAHLGRATVVTDEAFLPETGNYGVTSTFTAANGDELYTTGIVSTSPIAPDGTLTVTGTYTATGGTGRFAGASGTAVFDETAYLTDRGTAAGSYTLEGRLAY